jgi:hypothetical protein
VLAGSEGFWKYEVAEPWGPEDDMPIGAGKLYLESEEKCLRLHTAMGEVAGDGNCRTFRTWDDSARMEASMMQIVRGHSSEHAVRFVLNVDRSLLMVPQCDACPTSKKLA